MSQTFEIFFRGLPFLGSRLAAALFPPENPTAEEEQIHRHKEQDEDTEGDEGLHVALRRKTLVNSLQTGFSLPKDQLAAIVTGCGLPENVRGERLSLADYAALANALAAV